MRCETKRLPNGAQETAPFTIFEEIKAMDTEEIQEIIKLMDDNNLVEFELEKEGFRIVLKKGQPMIVAPGASVPTVFPSNMPLPQSAPEQAEAAEDTEVIVSPMVGTFYRASSPEASPFTDTGQELEVGQIICIIEAMKLMNEIKSEVAGKVKQILVENGEPVEFGQVLFLVEST